MQPRDVCSTLGDPSPPQVAICIYGAFGAEPKHLPLTRDRLSTEMNKNARLH